MYHITIENCNNITNGELAIDKQKLNILYGMNGTGKTTIANAIEYAEEPDKLNNLQSYISKDPVSVSIDPEIKKVSVFNEKFVNNIVFKEDEVIENSFEVFLKTPNYTQKKNQLNYHLENLHRIIIQDKEVNELQDLLDQIKNKFKRNADGKLSKTGMYKSILSKENLFNIPEELECYRPFIENTEINIQWIDWKSKGDSFDVGDSCPYCSKTLDRSLHDQRKEIFNQVYKKADSQNLKDLLDLLGELKQYIKSEKYNELVTYAKTEAPEDVISTIYTELINELDILLKRFTEIKEFGDKEIVVADINELDKQIKNMKIPVPVFEIFGSEKFDNIVTSVNSQVDNLLSEVSDIKKELGELKGVMKATIKESQDDINDFLKTAGINYEIVIESEDENNTRTLLKQCFGTEKTNVENIQDHLSWGEKNAFALILFMYYSVMQKPDLIILDDPISSFDENKKYAILHRMFKSGAKRKDVSLEGETVLLLTHDFEPIIDFMVIEKLAAEKVVAFYINNQYGTVNEQKINPSSDIKLIETECSEIAKDSSINIVSRIAFLRKLSELYEQSETWKLVYEILSCLIHASEIRRKVGNKKYESIPQDKINLGIERIKEYIPDFNFNELEKNTYTKEGLKDLYYNEEIPYLKIQIFREMNELLSGTEIKLSSMDSAWYKFIDETYHIENDYLRFLDILKFNIVPDYISKNVDSIVSKL